MNHDCTNFSNDCGRRDQNQYRRRRGSKTISKLIINVSLTTLKQANKCLPLNNSKNRAVKLQIPIRKMGPSYCTRTSLRPEFWSTMTTTRKTHRMDCAAAPCETQIAAFKAAHLTDIATYSCHGGIHIDVIVSDLQRSRCADGRFELVILSLRRL
jgi:hypothetical protein